MAEKTILVTGAAGYIGSVATELLLEEGYKVIALDNLSGGHKENLFSNIDFYETDLGNVKILKEIFTNHKIDLVLHFAGKALVEESTKNPMLYFDNNVCQGQALLDVMILFNVKKIVFSSTCAVYGIPNEDEIPIKEETPTKPINPYGESKLLFEKMLEWYKNNHNLKYISLRYFNVAGASAKRGENHNPETHLIPLIIKSSKDTNYKLKIYGNDYPTKDGTSIRDYVHVVDLINAHIKAIDVLIKEEEHLNVYNVGYGHGYTVLEIVHAAKEVLNKNIDFSFSQRRIGDPPILIANSTKIKRDLKWEPKYDDIYEIIISTSKFIKI